MTDTNLEMISLQQMADMVGMTRRTLYRQVQTGSWPVKRIRGVKPMKFAKKDVIAMLENK